MVVFFSSRRRHTRFKCDWSSDVCSSDLIQNGKTNTSGVYLFPLLKPGDYTVTVQESGFRVAVAKVTVTLGQTATVDLKLQHGDTTLNVEVLIGGAEMPSVD